MARTESDITTTDAIERFLVKCRVKNLSPHTISYYWHRLNRFNQWLDSDKVSDINAETVDRYILYLRSKGSTNDASIATEIRAVRALLYFLMESGDLEPFTVHVPKQTEKVKETYTKGELTALLKKPNLKKASFAEYRSWVMIAYFLATGNRVGTALNLKIEDCDFDNCLIRLCRTKNRKEQLIPMANSLKGILIEYLSIRGGKPSDYVFCGETGEQLSYTGCRDAIYDYNRLHGVATTGLHRFRHSFAKEWILSGGDPFRLQRMLGHSDISVTKQYCQMFATDLQQDFDKHNPLDNLHHGTTKISMKRRA